MIKYTVVFSDASFAKKYSDSIYNIEPVDRSYYRANKHTMLYSSPATSSKVLDLNKDVGIIIIGKKTIDNQLWYRSSDNYYVKAEDIDYIEKAPAIGGFSPVDASLTFKAKQVKYTNGAGLKDEPYADGKNLDYAGYNEEITIKGLYINKYNNYWVGVEKNGRLFYTCANNIIRIDDDASNDVKINGYNYAPNGIVTDGSLFPIGTKKKGAAFELRGTISSQYTIKTAQGFVYSGNLAKYSVEAKTGVVTINKKSFDLNKSNVNIAKNGGIAFGKLSEGYKAFRLVVQYEKWHDITNEKDNPLKIETYTKSFYSIFSIGSNNNDNPLADIVEDIKATGITLDSSSIIVGLGESYTLNASVSPNNATNKGIEWTSTDPSVATVTNGVVYAVGEGTATIIAATVDGSGIKATCTVTVIDNSGIAIDDVNFPDEVFREYVKQFDGNNNNRLAEAEVDSVTNINVNNMSIGTLKGVEYFTKLKKLYCYGNNLTELDISINTELEVLWCFSNNLTTLNVGNNTSLIELSFGDNYLTSIDISKNKQLIVLDCEDNQITSLNLGNNRALHSLYCHRNPLMSIDISDCPYLVNLVETTEPRANGAGTYSWFNDDCVLYIDQSTNMITSKGIEIDDAHFPDVVFQGYVKGFDSDGNGVLNQEEIKDITYIDVYEKSIQSLKGIEYFTELTYLWCQNNYLTSLDVSKNTKLQYLNCDCNQLTSLVTGNNPYMWFLSCSQNMITSLVLNNNLGLEQIICEENQLTSLNVSNNSELTWLNCSRNPLTALDVSNNPMLSVLCCVYNQLTSLDIQNNTKLIDLACFENKLTVLDISNNPDLDKLNCMGNQLTKLNIMNCPKLLDLVNGAEFNGAGWEAEDCWLYFDDSVTLITGHEQNGLVINEDNFPDAKFRMYVKQFDTDGNEGLSQEEIDAVTRIDVNNQGISTLKGLEYFTALIELHCASNNLTSLDVSKNIALDILVCRNNQLTSLDISGNTALTILMCQNNQLTDLDISQNTRLAYLYCASNQLTELDMSQCSVLVKLINENDPEEINNRLVWNGDINGDGEEDARIVVDLNVTVSGCEIISIDATNFPDTLFREYVKQFDINGSGGLSQEEIGAVTIIDISSQGINTLKGLEYFTSLKELYCYSNQLTSLDVSKNTALIILNCGYNELTGLDVSQNTTLTTLDCRFNQLTSLNVSKNPAVKELICNNNQLSKLIVNGDTALETLWCDNNQLSELNISKNASLSSLTCYGNQLTALNISKNTALKEVFCGNNQLNALDVSKNPALKKIVCYDNQLNTLDVSKNTALTYLNCDNNQLSSLDVGKNTALESLWCRSNQLTELDVSKNVQLKWLGCIDNPLSRLDISKCPTLVKLIQETQPVDQNTYYTWQTNAAWLEVDKTLELKTEPDQGDKITAFVTRCYELILGRNPDPQGLNTWCTNLNSGLQAAAEIIDSFVRSNEFKGKKLSNADAVEILYKTMLGRGSDPGGKANWVKKLDDGQPLAAVINGFCGSNEFKAICESYGIRPGSVDVPEEEPKTPDDKIKAFVKRCYKIILGRGADEKGLNDWFNYLKTKQKAASEIIDGFVNSPEFLGKKYSNEESVEILYKAMLGRGSDPKGKANWVAKLNNKQPFAVVINGFCGSQEFMGLCASYGIEPGRVNIKVVVGQSEEELAGLAYNAEEPITKRSEDKPNRVSIINPSDTIDPNIGTAVQAVYINEEKAKEFVSRCYQYILGRSASDNELAGWMAQMTNGTKTADQIARGFLFSDEFKGRNVGNLDLVKILYRVYLNRDADPAGLASWTAKLDSGVTLKEVLDSLVKTGEYKNVISEMGK